MVRFRVLPFLALGCFVWISAIPARADGLPPPLPPEWNVSGALLLVGNNVCAGLPCTETIAFSFDAGYQFLPEGVPGFSNVYELYFSNLVETGSGALGSFTKNSPGPQFLFLANPPFSPGGLVPGGPCSSGFDFNNINVGVPVGAEIDMQVCQAFVSTPTPPSIVDAYLYACNTKTCATDFAPFPSGTLPQQGIFGLVFEVSTVRSIPEPGPLTLLFSGLLLLGLRAASRKVLTNARITSHASSAKS